MVRITVILLSVKHQNFFTFQDVKYAYPPHTVNVPFISSHIKYQGRHKNRIYQHDSFTFHVGFSLWLLFFFFTRNWIQSFFKEILLVIRNVRGWIGFPSELRVGAADFQSISLNKKDDTRPLLDANIFAWIELSL